MQFFSCAVVLPPTALAATELEEFGVGRLLEPLAHDIRRENTRRT